jgi:hypothetical protein
VWVTDCHPEHPDHANRNWSLDGSELYNARSKRCLTMSQQLLGPPAEARRGLQQAQRHAVLGDCNTALKWTRDQQSLRSSDGCLAVQPASAPPGPVGHEPSPPFPNPLPNPSTVVAQLELGGQIATSGGRSYASFNFDWQYVLYSTTALALVPAASLRHLLVASFSQTHVRAAAALLMQRSTAAMPSLVGTTRPSILAWI